MRPLIAVSVVADFLSLSLSLISGAGAQHAPAKTVLTTGRGQDPQRDVRRARVARRQCQDRGLAGERGRPANRSAGRDE